MKAKTMRRIYLREAAVMLVLARLAVRFIPPARVFAWANRPPPRIRRFAGDQGSWISWSVEDLGPAREGGGLAAHAWVEIGEDKIVGGAEAEGFTCLAEFGGAY